MAASLSCYGMFQDALLLIYLLYVRVDTSNKPKTMKVVSIDKITNNSMNNATE